MSSLNVKLVAPIESACRMPDAANAVVFVAAHSELECLVLRALTNELDYHFSMCIDDDKLLGTGSCYAP